MASIKVKLHPSVIAGSEGTVYYQIIHNRRVRQLYTDYRLHPSEWDDRQSAITTGINPDRKNYLLDTRERIRRDITHITRIIARLETETLEFTADDIITEFSRYSSEFTLIRFMKQIITKLHDDGRIRTSETYTSTLNSFRHFLLETLPAGMLRSRSDIPLDSITTETMESYEAWLRQRKVVPNTISFYTRILRAVYNRAVSRNIIENRQPFRNVYTGIDRTVKRALPIAKIRKIKSLDLSSTPYLDYARDMFILSFCLRGMSFIDMAFLRKTDLRNGYITYRRRKTGQKLTIAWTPLMQQILTKYPENPTAYLLPIIRTQGTNEIYTYRNAAYNINRNLKIIAAAVGISIPLTLYVARHSWASAAQSKGIPISVISEGMGHESETTTRIYLASLDTTVIDRANALILSSI